MSKNVRVVNGDLHVRHDNGAVIIDAQMSSGDTIVLRMSPAKALFTASALTDAAGSTRTNDVVTVLRAIETFADRSERQFGKTSFTEGIRAAINKGLDAFMKL
jgi:hypothetical protein